MSQYELELISIVNSGHIETINFENEVSSNGIIKLMIAAFVPVILTFVYRLTSPPHSVASKLHQEFQHLWSFDLRTELRAEKL